MKALNCLAWILAACALSTVAVIGQSKAPSSASLLAAERAAADALITNNAIPSLRIELSEEAVETLRLAERDPAGRSALRPTVTATVREGSQVYTNVALHLKGSLGSFRLFDDKPGLTLNFDKFADGQRFHGLQKIHLNNSVQDATYISEILCRELFLAAGVPTPRATHAKVTLNERDLGLYVLVEGCDKTFLRRHFRSVRGNLYDTGVARDIDGELRVTSGDRPDDRSRLQDLLAAAQETNAVARLDALSAVLDVDRFLTFTAMESMLVHWDGYAMNRNNYHLFHDRSTDRFVFLPHGLDQMFGTWRTTPSNSITPMVKGVVARAVIQAPEGRQRFLDRMSELTERILVAESITNRVRQLAAKLRPFFARDMMGWLEQQSAVEQLCDRIVARCQSVRTQLVTATTPLAFDTKGEAKLNGWQTSRELGRPRFNRVFRPDGVVLLQITAPPGRPSYGTYRTQVLLAPGRYTLVASAKATDVTVDAEDPRGGVVLRLSGDRSARTWTGTFDWQTLTYDFTVDGIADIELICELRATEGKVEFEADSLRLIRRDTPRLK